MISDIDALMDRRQTGYSLPRPFYTDADVYRLDTGHVFSKLWMLVGHVSQIPEPGDYFLAEIAGESICVVRRDKEDIGAFYDVSPHACHVLLFEGLIFICLAGDSPPDVDSTLQEIAPFVKPQNLAGARVIHETVLATDANWKLVVENFWECNHCEPSHPEFMTVHGRNWVLAMGAGLGACVSEQAEMDYREEFKAFEARAQSLGHPFGSASKLGLASTEFWQVLRSPLAEGCYSETRYGRKVGPLMGDLKSFDGGIDPHQLQSAGFTLVVQRPCSHFQLSADGAHVYGCAYDVAGGRGRGTGQGFQRGGCRMDVDDDGASGQDDH